MLDLVKSILGKSYHSYYLFIKFFKIFSQKKLIFKIIIN